MEADAARWPRLQSVDIPASLGLPSTRLSFSEVDGSMFCTLCNKYGEVAPSGIATWTKEPCVLIRLESVHRHSKSLIHKDAIAKELTRQRSATDGGVVAAFDSQWKAEEAAVSAAFSSVYFLAQEEIAHTTKYEALMRFISHLGLPHLETLNKGGNAKYTSYHTVDELLTIIGEEVRQNIHSMLQQSPYVGLICDETTDVSTTKQLVIYAKAIVQSAVRPFFLALKEIPDGTAESVKENLKEGLAECGLTIDRVAALGSDGASVMTGRVNGVAARLRQEQPSLVSIHCIALRLLTWLAL